MKRFIPNNLRMNSFCDNKVESSGNDVCEKSNQNTIIEVNNDKE